MIKNQLKTAILMASLTAVLLWVGQLLGGYTGLIFAGIFVVGMNFFSYFYSDKLVLRMYKAKPVTKDEQPDLYWMVKDVAHLAKVPIPKIYIIEDASPNAFATGRNPKHAAVAVTTGIMHLLSKDELKGVIAHEFAHIKNRDILIGTVAATVAGVISYVATMAQWAAIFGGFGGRNDDNSSGLELLVLAILTPIIATVIQLAISRSREYLADESAARMLKNPDSLARALAKLKTGIAHRPMRHGSEQTANLFIANPFNKKGLTELFSTHPNIDERINKLKNMRI